MKFRVGRLVNGKLQPAFTVSRTDNGGVSFSDLHTMTDREHQIVLAHYGRLIHGKVVLNDEQHIRVFKPGTKKHFEHASYKLPLPFALMPGAN